MKAVYKRELMSYFNTMTGYVYTAIVAVFIGIFFMIYNLKIGYPYFAYSLANCLIVFVFAVPILTMRSMAEERRSRTDQMLLTYPVSVTGMVLGKFFAMLTVYAVPMAISCLCPIVIAIAGEGSLLIDYSTIFMFLCLGALFVAIGMFISSLTESLIIAAIGSMAIFLVLMIWNTLIGYIPETAAASAIGFFVAALIIAGLVYRSVRSRAAAAVITAAGAVAVGACWLLASDWLAGALKKALSSLAIYDIVNNFSRYFVFDVKGIVLLLSFAALFVFLTVQSVQRRRWS